VIVASAGHVDHGKTSLVKQLTGVDTDRLEEEKRRGLTINLGFAYSRGAGQQTIGFIDVPGHHRFINNMIAGVRGIDMGMLVVAADDGPMPQTFEHLDIMRLLGVNDFVVAVTKVDRVEQSRVAEVCDTMQALLADACPVFAVNAIDGSGVDELKQFLYGRAEQLGARSDAGYFRLSIDRSFLLKGTGLVVTGTAMSGRVSVGDTLKLSPQGKSIRIRTIHSEDEAVATCKAGQRCALSVVGDVRKEHVSRGDYLLDEKLALPTARFDARMHLLLNSPFGLKHLSPVKLYIGANRKRAKLFLLQRRNKSNMLNPGENCLVQLIIDGEIACCSGDRFLLRDDSESVTLGGGVVLDSHAPRIAKTSFFRLTYLEAMEVGTVSGSLQTLLIDHQQVVNLSRFKQSCNLRDDELGHVLLESTLAEKIRLFKKGETEFAVATKAWDAEEQNLKKVLTEWHREKPKEIGMPLKELKTRLTSSTEPELCDAVIAEQQKRGFLNISSGLASASSHQYSMSLEAERQWSDIRQAMANHGTDIPVLSNLQKVIACDEISLARALDLAVKNGKAICLTKSRFALPSVLCKLAESVGDLTYDEPQFSIKEFKNHAGLSRNLTVEVLEYFDSIGFTRRDGDKRSVIDAEFPGKYFKSM
jgi:selenocysteine-specific elongation factor